MEALHHDCSGGKQSSPCGYTIPGWLAAILILVFGAGIALTPTNAAQAHFIYTCPGYSYNSKTGAHTLPSAQGCNTNPYTNPAVHQWAVEQAKLILFYDGYVRYATLLQSPIRIGGTGEGRRHVDLLTDGMIAADTLLNGCTSYGASVGWPIGDHMLNPYRHFGVFSYYLSPSLPGWHGWAYPRTGSCANAPRVRTNSARLSDEFFARAQNEWRAFRPGNAMYNLGIALHAVQDATVPSHVHPEYKTKDHFPPLAGVPLDSYPAWANENRIWNGVSSGGLYNLPTSSNGVMIARSAGGWVYWMASIAYQYSYWDPATSALPRSRMKCNVTRSPEGCPAEAAGLLRLTQRASAGFIRFF